MLGDIEQAEQILQRALTEKLKAQDVPHASDLYSEIVEGHMSPPALSVENRLAMAAILMQRTRFRLSADLYLSIANDEANTAQAEMSLLKAMRLYDNKLVDPVRSRLCAALLITRFPHSEWRQQAVQIQQRGKDSLPTVPN